jgi:hypothetical protein
LITRRPFLRSVSVADDPSPDAIAIFWKTKGFELLGARK